MRRINQALLVAGCLLFASLSTQAQAKTDGLLIVGTQAEVKAALAETGLVPRFSQDQADEMVAVTLTRGEMRCFEGEAAKKIVEFVGDVVKGGVAFTMEVGSKLWNFIKGVPATTVAVAKHALKAAAWVLSHGKTLVVDGVTFVAKTSHEVLKCVADLVKHLLTGPTGG